MSMDKILTIPHLSKELDLIGQSILPYKLVHKKISSKKLCQHSEEAMKIVFDSKKMIDALISTCFELVKQIKAFELHNEESEIDKVKYDNAKLQKQLNVLKVEQEKMSDVLAAEKSTNSCLKTKLDQLEEQIKNYEITVKKLSKQNVTNEDVLRHNLKKKESDLDGLHKVIWKQFNMADRKYLPQNFEIVTLQQPNFSKLWSEVKYSSAKNKEDALKKAVCKFQENNQVLMENNSVLKRVLLLTLEKISEIYNVVHEKIFLSETTFLRFNCIKIFQDLESIDLPMYEQFLNKHLNVFNKICELFEGAKFSVSDDTFVCWSDIIKKLNEWVKNI